MREMNNEGDIEKKNSEGGLPKMSRVKRFISHKRVTVAFVEARLAAELVKKGIRTMSNISYLMYIDVDVLLNISVFCENDTSTR
jgi:hypothetical protein